MSVQGAAHSRRPVYAGSPSAFKPRIAMLLAEAARRAEQNLPVGSNPLRLHYLDGNELYYSCPGMAANGLATEDLLQHEISSCLGFNVRLVPLD
jgi:hypothetical protein